MLYSVHSAQSKIANTSYMFRFSVHLWHENFEDFSPNLTLGCAWRFVCTSLSRASIATSDEHVHRCEQCWAPAKPVHCRRRRRRMPLLHHRLIFFLSYAWKAVATLVYWRWRQRHEEEGGVGEDRQEVTEVRQASPSAVRCTCTRAQGGGAQAAHDVCVRIGWSGGSMDVGEGGREKYRWMDLDPAFQNFDWFFLKKRSNVNR